MAFDFFETLFLIPLLAVGFLSVFTDIKGKKIYNKVICLGFVSGFILFFYFLFNDYNGAYLASMLINFSISLLVSYALWFFNCWSAGDAKLFSLFCFLLPLSFYQNSNYPFFPSFNILINLFIPVIAFLIFLSLVDTFKAKDFNIKKCLNLVASFIKTSFVYIALFLVFKNLFGFFLSSNYLFFQTVYFIFMFLTIKIVNNFLEKHFFLNYLLIFSTIGFCFYLLFTGRESLVQTVFFRVYVFLGAVFLLRALINNYIDKCETEEIKPEDLKEGMVVIFENKAKKVNEENIEEIKKLSNIKTYKVFPFSLFIFTAVIITIITKGSLLIFIF